MQLNAVLHTGYSEQNLFFFQSLLHENNTSGNALPASGPRGALSIAPPRYKYKNEYPLQLLQPIAHYLLHKAKLTKPNPQHTTHPGWLGSRVLSFLRMLTPHSPPLPLTISPPPTPTALKAYKMYSAIFNHIWLPGFIQKKMQQWF